MDLKESILNGEYKDRILSIEEIKEKKEDIIELLKNLMSYSTVIFNEESLEKYKKEIESYKHWIVILSDFDLKPEEKLKLKAEFSAKYLDLIKSNKLDIWLHILLIDDIKNISMDSKFELLDLLSLGDVLYDKGFLEIVKLTAVHKRLILYLLQKYVVAYVLAGSQVKGRSVESSDIDVYVVIDDTDVKQHTFEELKAKLITTITEKAVESRLLTGSKKVLHPQVYTLTEYWLALSESNPVIITFLRDGIALYDRGMFIAWKQLLSKGIIKPSRESSDKYITLAENSINEARNKLKNTINNLIIEDLAVSMVTAAQSVIMDYGILPPDPKETPEYLRKIFVEKNLLEKKYIDDLELVWKMRKDFEHGLISEYKYEDLINVFNIAEKFVSQMKNLKNIIDKDNEKKLIDNYIAEYEKLKEEFKLLYNQPFMDYVNNNISVEYNNIKSLEDNINKFKDKKFDLIEMEKFKEQIIYYTRLLRDIIENKKEELIIKYKYTLIDNNLNKSYDLYITKDKIYLVSEGVTEIYNYNGEKTGSINDINYRSQILNEINNSGIEHIDNKVIDVFNKIFKLYSITK
ncbi:DNA polymerase subunit beta [Nanobdella aerobiophila]|uniref:DNA polymerase subunit beta n=1 Tax=Nanobdella aerobiophila TaxID=2586965 RepID=A0A915WSE8_9ARCH|nr:nucleotidyltransferase domain-containing protein [Nanobdella aerobiophila]BBL45866.1 DNA polymerase subunit beta [Nanobdella aerobiophila]